jgi:predicted HicB family RNase H-like nuclease
MENKNKKRHQISFDISQDMHQQIKLFAVMRNISMNNWMHRAIIERLEKEKVSDERSNMPTMQ